MTRRRATRLDEWRSLSVEWRPPECQPLVYTLSAIQTLAGGAKAPEPLQFFLYCRFDERTPRFARFGARSEYYFRVPCPHRQCAARTPRTQPSER
jgi:hypothetical protein